MSQVKVVALWRYPVKGLAGERIARAELRAGETIAFDRAYAIENGEGPFDPATPRHLPKTVFLCLMRDERLATLGARFEEATRELSLRRDGAAVTAPLDTPDGRARLEAFIAGDMAGSLRGRPRIVSAAGHSFSDVKEKCLHIVNLASLRAVEQATGRAIDPLRFRANVIVDGLEPWAELDLLGREIGLGAARLAVFKRTVRCAATNVDPTSGLRAGDLPDELWRVTGHRDFGVYASVVAGGPVAEGDAMRVD